MPSTITVPLLRKAMAGSIHGAASAVKTRKNYTPWPSRTRTPPSEAIGSVWQTETLPNHPARFPSSEQVIPCNVLCGALEVGVKRSRQLFVLLLAVSLIFVAVAVNAQQIDPKTYGGMKWRLI